MFRVQIGRIGLTALVAAWIAVITLLAPSAEAGERPGTRHSVEFALLQSITWVSRPTFRYFDDPVLEQEHRTTITFPAAAPGVRLTFWGRSVLIVDFGITYLNTSQGEGQFTYGETDLVLEGGPGLDLASADAKFRPFVGGLGGLLVSKENPEGYIGGQAGFRYFVREYAATRFQVGYRRTMGDNFKIRAFEIAGGVSFFL